MAKRSNPYSEDYIKQSKTHVGLKQFNNNEDRIKVYEKTLQLLYRGAKKTPNKGLLQCSDVTSTVKKDGKKQLFIGKDGSLLHCGTLATEKKNIVQHCTCSGLNANHCAYCESAVCAMCQHQCVVCFNLYCSKCSMIGCEGTDICVSCYT